MAGMGQMFDQPGGAMPSGAAGPVMPGAAVDDVSANAMGSKSGVLRDVPQDIPDAVKNLVKKITKEIEADKAHWKKDFDNMREDMRFARDGGLKSWVRSGKYTANIVQRHINGKVAKLYAKNPKVVVRRKKRRDFKVWDGNPTSIQVAMQQTQMVQVLPGMAPPQALMQAQALLMDAAQGIQRRRLMDNIADTLQVLIQNQMFEQSPPFKRRMKKLVRTAITTGVGYIKLGFQRLYEKSPETAQRIAEIETRLGAAERMMADIRDDEIREDDAQVEELRGLLKALHAEQEVLAHEGLVFDFPSPMAIIPHRKCHTLSGFMGADWVTEEFMMSPDQVQEIWQVDLSQCSYKGYTASGGTIAVSPEGKTEKVHEVCVWQNYNRRTGMVYTLADGYENFLEEPSPPPVRLERFWPWFTLVLNELEDDTTVFPPSDSRLLRPMQLEYNRIRQAAREHRRANRPKYAVAKGKLSESDKDMLKNHPDSAVLELEAMSQGEKVEDLLQPVKPIGMDPSLYETNTMFEDFQRVGGSQEANLGGVSGGTATESSIAESSRASDLGSNTDDLDDLLCELFREAGQLCLSEFSTDQVEVIVGQGAVWPEWSAVEIAGELYLEVEAGSSGRPNRAVELQNYKELVPLLLQIPGMKPDFLIREGVRRMDDRLEVEDAYDPNLPAILALNKQAQLATGDPASDPGQQGGEGGDNVHRPPGSEQPLPAPGGQSQREGGAAGGMRG